MEPTDRSSWRLLASREQYRGYSRVRRDTYLLPDGSESDWDVLVQEPAVAVVAFTLEGTVLLFDQYRVGPARVVPELPGGLVDPGEPPLAAAARELEEETGYRPTVIFDAGAEWASANSTRRRHVVIAGGCVPVGEPRWGRNEVGQVREIPASDLLALLLSGEPTDAGPAVRGLLVFARAQVGPELAETQRVVRSLVRVTDA